MWKVILVGVILKGNNSGDGEGWFFYFGVPHAFLVGVPYVFGSSLGSARFDEKTFFGVIA